MTRRQIGAGLAAAAAMTAAVVLSAPAASADEVTDYCGFSEETHDVAVVNGNLGDGVLVYPATLVAGWTIEGGGTNGGVRAVFASGPDYLAGSAEVGDTAFPQPIMDPAQATERMLQCNVRADAEATITDVKHTPWTLAGAPADRLDANWNLNTVIEDQPVSVSVWLTIVVGNTNPQSYFVGSSVIGDQPARDAVEAILGAVHVR